jgi:hypothetical protein
VDNEVALIHGNSIIKMIENFKLIDNDLIKT